MKALPRGPTTVGRLPLLLAGLLPAACGDDPAGPVNGDPANGPQVSLAVELVASGIPAPVHLISPPGDDRLLVLEQGGRVRVIRDGELLGTPFLDLSGQVSTSGSEQGLLSMAFHPDYAGNGRFYVNFTDGEGDTRVVRFSVSDDPDVADPGSGALVLEVEQPYANHNGGHIVFGPDGMLYVAMGDGGSGGDPEGHGQDMSTLLGALLRIDVDGGDPYAIPPTNPLVGDPDARDEIWAFGLRNPWRIAFDPPDGVLYVADVGQDRWEEVNAVPASEPGLNYGWNLMEGPECFLTDPCDPVGLVLPVVSYRIGSEGCAVIGGGVYRGSAIPEVLGHYFYSDFCAGWLRSFRLEGGEAVNEVEWPLGDLGRILSMGVDSSGELYLLSTDDGGAVYRIVKEES